MTATPDPTSTPPTGLPLQRVAYAGLALAALAQTVFISLPAEYLVDRVTIDDLFLYLQVAWNHAMTGTPSFDGLHPTNGYQPIWEAILAGICAITRDREIALRTSLAAAALCNLATAVILAKVAAVFVDSHAAKVAGSTAMLAWCSWLLFPASVDGMESQLAGLVFAWACLVTLRKLPPGTSPTELSYGNLALLGFVWTLNSLVRLDGGFVSLGVGLWICGRLLPAGGTRRAIAFAVIPVCAVACYLIGNEVVFGMTTPVSGRAKLFWVWEGTPDTAGPWRIAARGIAETVAGTALRVVGAAGSRLVPLAGIVVAAVVLAHVAARRAILRGPALSIAAGLLLQLVALNVLLQRFGSSYWYYQPLRVWLAVALGIFGGRLLLRFLAKAPAAYLFGAILLGGASINSVRHLAEYDEKSMPVQRIHTARWLAKDSTLPAEARIGSWNAGALGWFGHPRTVVNLDGLVQSRRFLDEVLRASDRQASLRTYLEHNQIDYLVDYDAPDATQTFGSPEPPDALRFRGFADRVEAPTVRQFGTMEVIRLR